MTALALFVIAGVCFLAFVAALVVDSRWLDGRGPALLLCLAMIATIAGASLIYAEQQARERRLCERMLRDAATARDSFVVRVNCELAGGHALPDTSGK